MKNTVIPLISKRIIIEKDESLVNLANEIIRVTHSLKTNKDQFLLSLQIILDAGKEQLQSDFSTLANSWTSLYLTYLDFCQVTDHEVVEWIKLARDMMSVRNLDHTRYCGARLLTKLIQFNKAPIMDKDWGNILGLLTSGDDLLVEMGLNQLSPKMFEAAAFLVQSQPTNLNQKHVLDNNTTSIIGAALEVFTCERSYIKRTACLRFFGHPAVYSSLSIENKQELAVLLKADLVNDCWTQEPVPSVPPAPRNDHDVAFVEILSRLFGEDVDAVRDLCQEIIEAVKNGKF